MEFHLKCHEIAWNMVFYPNDEQFIIQKAPGSHHFAKIHPYGCYVAAGPSTTPDKTNGLPRFLAWCRNHPKYYKTERWSSFSLIWHPKKWFLHKMSSRKWNFTSIAMKSREIWCFTLMTSNSSSTKHRGHMILLESIHMAVTWPQHPPPHLIKPTVYQGF